MLFIPIKIIFLKNDFFCPAELQKKCNFIFLLFFRFFLKILFFYEYFKKKLKYQYFALKC